MLLRSSNTYVQSTYSHASPSTTRHT
jgi:hypothetical protein